MGRTREEGRGRERKGASYIRNLFLLLGLAGLMFSVCVCVRMRERRGRRRERKDETEKKKDKDK